jgi:hypothetical protein
MKSRVIQDEPERPGRPMSAAAPPAPRRRIPVAWLVTAVVAVLAVVIVLWWSLSSTG